MSFQLNPKWDGIISETIRRNEECLQTVHNAVKSCSLCEYLQWRRRLGWSHRCSRQGRKYGVEIRVLDAVTVRHMPSMSRFHIGSHQTGLWIEHLLSSNQESIVTSRSLNFSGFCLQLGRNIRGSEGLGRQLPEVSSGCHVHWSVGWRYLISWGV